MLNKNLVRNYASALFSSKVHDLTKEQIHKQLQLVDHSINDNPDFKKTLSSPIISHSNKIKIINAIKKAFNFDEIVHNFLLLLIKNSRIDALPEIIKFYQDLLDKSNNIKKVLVFCVTELSENEKNMIQTYLANKLKMQIELSFIQDSNIIGGIIIRYDSIVEDYSIYGNLEKLRNYLKTSNIMLEKNQ